MSNLSTLLFKDDLRQCLYSYEHPLAERTINGVNFRIASGFITDGKKTYLLYADGKIIGSFGSEEEAKQRAENFKTE